MATSGNGTFIPMVSSSPPPMDDVTFDEDEDEFSNFSGAPLGLDSPPGKLFGTKKGSFAPIKSDFHDPFHSADDTQSSNKDEDFGTFAAFGSSSFSNDKQNSNARLVSNNNVGGHSLNGNEGDEEDEFADFAAFQSNPGKESNTKDESVLDNGRQNEKDIVPPSVVLNKNNSHENCESHSAHYPHYPHSIEELGNGLDKTSGKLLNQVGYSDDSLSTPEMPHSGTNTAHQDDGGVSTDFQTRIPSQSSLDYHEPTHEHKDTLGDHVGSESERRAESESSAPPLEKPSTGSLSLFQQSDRQTFDSGIDSIMTPSDSSPEGKDDCSVKDVCEEDTNSDNPSPGTGPSAGIDDEWGDFDTFSSDKGPTDTHTKQSLETDRTDIFSPVTESSSKTQNSNVSGELERTRHQLSDRDDRAEGELSNSVSTHKFVSGNMSNSLSKPQSETTVQFDDIDDDDDFGDFSNAKQESPANVIPSKVQDDDFGDFESTKSTSEHKLGKQVQDKRDNSWGNFSSDQSSAPAPADEFGDFGAFGSNAGTAKGIGSAEDSKDDEFGTFSSSAGSALSSKRSTGGSDEFGSFGSSGSMSGSSASVIPSTTGNVSTKVPPGGRVERLFKSCFPGSMGGSPTDQAVQILQDIVAVKKPLPSKAKADKSVTNAVVWGSLSDMENTMAQKYHWNDSKNSGKLLSSLGIDSRNILPPGRGGRPLFAQELGMLTPSKPGEGVEGGGSGDVSSGAEDGISTHSSGPEDTVPKVEFDWSNSGLINPLDANSLNLDFFANERKSSSSRHKSRSVQKVDPELLDFAVSPSDPPLQPALTPSSSSSQSSSSSSSSQRKSSPNALDEILKHSSSSIVKQKPKREAGLSSEANSVLDALPDLSYMLAKVLMFPVASSVSSSPSKPAKKDAVQGVGWAESIS